REHPTTSIMLNRGFNELTIIWQDPATGTKCMCKLDDYYDGIPSDLKSSNDISYFHRNLYKMNYHIGAGHYVNGCLAVGLPARYFCFLAAQTTATYPVRVGYLNPERLVQAQAECSRLLGLIKE